MSNYAQLDQLDAAVGRLLLAVHTEDPSATAAVLDELNIADLRKVTAILAEGLALAEAESFEGKDLAIFDAMRRIAEALDDATEAPT